MKPCDYRLRENYYNPKPLSVKEKQARETAKSLDSLNLKGGVDDQRWGRPRTPFQPELLGRVLLL